MGRLHKFVLVLFVLLQTLSAQDKVRVVLDSIYSYSVGGYKKFNVILPKDYHQTDRRYRVIFLLHGYSGDHNDWINRTNLVEYLSNYSFVVVTPEADNSWYTNSPFVKNRNYEDYIIKELIPYVERRYRVLASKHGRAIAGLSMGGYGAIKFAFKYPNLFYYAGSFSGAFRWPSMIEKNKSLLSQSLREAFGETRSEHWDKNDVLAIADTIKPADLPYLYISCGANDLLEGLLDSNRKLVEKLQKNGVLYEYHELPGGHNWLFWDREIKSFLQRLSEYKIN
jgi:S-formylglutathione hydrolase FrmB